MKEIVLINTMSGINHEVVIDDYKFIFDLVDETDVTKYTGTLENYANAVYQFLEKDDATKLNEIGHIFYAMNIYSSDPTNVIGSSVELVRLCDKSSLNRLSTDITSKYFCGCKELFEKIAKSAEPDTTEEPVKEETTTATDDSDVIETTAEIVDISDRITSPPVDVVAQEEAAKARRERIKMKKAQVEAYYEESKKQKTDKLNNNPTTPIILPAQPQTTTETHSKECNCGCHNHHKMTEEEYRQKLAEASTWGLVKDPMMPIEGIDYNVPAEFVDIKSIQSILDNHMENYKHNEVYWRAVPRCFLRDTPENNAITDNIAQGINERKLPRPIGNQGWWYTTYYDRHILDVTSINMYDKSPIPALSMIIDYRGEIGKVVNPMTNQMEPVPTIYVGCSVIQHEDFINWCNGIRPKQPLLIQAVPFTMKNLSVLMSRIDYIRSMK